MFSVAGAWLWFGMASFGFAAIAFYVMSLKARPEDKHHYLISMLIVLVANSSYTAMSIGQSHITLSDGHALFYGRYIDWAITTPLLLLGLASIGMRAISVNRTIVYGLMAVDEYMIITGLIGGLSVDSSRWIWYTWSCIAFVAVLALLWGPVRIEARAQGREVAYVRLAALLTILWIQYPFAWFFGDEGMRIIPSVFETAWYTSLDVAAKVVFGFASLAAVKALPPAIEEGGTIVSSESQRRVVPASA